MWDMFNYTLKSEGQNIILQIHMRNIHLLLGDAKIQELWVREKVISILAENRLSMGQTTAKRTQNVGLRLLFK